MADNELSLTPLHQLAPMMRARELSPVDLVEAFLGKIEKTNDTLKAYITVAVEKARWTARAQTDLIQTGGFNGWWHGIP
jgi:Asp-tRNA(Asn)/Glu-tRNA(Gln) amidotransferase A subunit family amidase